MTDPPATAARKVVDLSLPAFPSHSLVNSNDGSKAFLKIANSIPELRSAIVLEHGHVVAEYYRALSKDCHHHQQHQDQPTLIDDDDNPVPHKVYSVTKSWMGLIIGRMIQDGCLRLEETLGDIFDEVAWTKST